MNLVLSKNNSFEVIYSEAVENAIKIMGDTVSKIVIDYLNYKHSINITKTYNNPSLLDDALSTTINGGKLIIERRIINYIYDKLGLVENKSSRFLSFEKRINIARDKYKVLKRDN